MLPALYVSHGSPMLTLEPGPTGAAFDALGATLRARRPRAVLVISAQWIYSTLAVTMRERQEARHDFGGFPKAIYALRYDVPGAPPLAQRVKALVEAAGIRGAAYVAPDEERTLDHGAWLPLRHFFPDADVPVVQLALNPYLPPAAQIRIGQALAPLRAEGALIVGSGSFTHDERDNGGVAQEPYVETFRAWMLDALDEALATGDTARIAGYRSLAPFARRVHPSDEHLLPFYVALGAALGPVSGAVQPDRDAVLADAAVWRVAGDISYGVLATDTLVFEGMGTGVQVQAEPA